MDAEHLQPQQQQQNALTATSTRELAKAVSRDGNESRAEMPPPPPPPFDLLSLVDVKKLMKDAAATEEEQPAGGGEWVETRANELPVESQSLPSRSPVSPVESTSTSDENVVIQRPAPLDQTTKNFPRRNRYGHRAAQTALNRTRGSGTNPAKALELLRKVLHSSFEKEVLPVCRSYMEILKMGAQNLRENTGEAVADIHIISALRRSLEEIGQTLDPSYQSKALLEHKEHRGTTSTATNGHRHRKRKEVKEQSAHTRPPPAKVPKMSVPLENLEASGMTWNPDEVNEETRFVMGVKANKAIGFAATRGRIYYRHPELYKYSGDQDDKMWLYDHGHMPVTGGKAYLMLEQDLIKLCKTEEYSNNPTVNRNELVGFVLPPSMVEKIKADMRKQRQAFQL